MDVVYGSQSPEKAFFDFKVNAKDFDIKRAYTEIKMFREMASSQKCRRAISLGLCCGRNFKQ
jgi:AsmA protein